MIKLTLLTLTALLLSACTSPQASEEISIELNKNFPLRINQTAVLEEKDFQIKFLEITEDSRCPSDVDCFWAGQVIAKLQSKNNAEISLKTQEEKIIENYKVQLLDIQPYPKTSQKIESTNYIATLRISEK